MYRTAFKVIFLIFLILIGDEIQAQDWANLERFREENAQLGQPAPGENRVVFMGNSITEGWSRHSPSFFEGKPYINRGISGQTTPQMMIRFRPDVIDLEPEVVVILAGTNDIAGNTGPSSLDMIMDNLKSMAELARANDIKVILCSVLPAYDYPWRPGLRPDEKIPALNEMIKAYALQNNFIYLDYFASMVDERNGLKDKYTYDGVHPNEAGYLVMGPMAEEAIRKALDK
ncbi:MAG: SGNH/GDSL hydrolase family protein [Bacteroidales bacterium]|jgi:lysophospholipase L1-like esterase|nr:SGNH/GDSL hydrolase family protein [Bacteroidales bacterium]